MASSSAAKAPGLNIPVLIYLLILALRVIGNVDVRYYSQFNLFSVHNSFCQCYKGCQRRVQILVPHLSIPIRIPPQRNFRRPEVLVPAVNTRFLLPAPNVRFPVPARDEEEERRPAKKARRNARGGGRRGDCKPFGGDRRPDGGDENGRGGGDGGGGGMKGSGLNNLDLKFKM